jgi:prevent-host-death family protein
MTRVSVRDLRNHGGDVLDSVVRGENVTVTRQGKPIAELRPLTVSGTPAAGLPARWRGIPVLNLAELRTDLDDVLDPAL